MNLHLSTEFDGLIRDTAQSIDLPEFHIRKDYWVTLSLKALSESPYAESAVFKGGTSLSKAYRLIDRFSEDIDLAILPGGLSTNQIKRKIKKVHDATCQHLTYVEGHPKESKGSTFRRTMHQFPYSETSAIEDQVSRELMIEVNSFTTPSPYNVMPIQSMITDVLLENSLDKVVAKFELEPFNLQILALERTLIEKILAIVRQSYSEKPIAALQNKIRHLYDIHQIMQRAEAKSFISNAELYPLVQQCISEEKDIEGFTPSTFYKIPLTDAPIFSEFDEWLPELDKVYRTSFSAMTYKELPPLNSISKTLKTIRRALSK